MRRFAALALLVVGLAATGCGDKASTPAAVTPRTVPPITVPPLPGPAPRLVSAVVTLRDADEHPMEKCRVEAIETGTSWKVFTGDSLPDGTLTLTSLDPAKTFELRVGRPLGKAWVEGTTVPGWKPSDTTVHLPTYGEVHGTCEDAFGRPVPNVRVAGPLPSTPVPGELEAVTGEDGAFTVTGFWPARSVELRVFGSLTADDAPPLATQTVRVGDRRAVLRVSLGGTLTVVLPRDAANRYIELVAAGKVVASAEAAKSTATAARPAGPTRPFGSPAVRGPSRASFVGLSPTDNYTVWVPPGADGRYGLLEDVPADGREHAVTLVPGEPIDVRLVIPSEVPQGSKGRIDISAERDGLVAFAGWDKDARRNGSTRFAGLPKGRWKVMATTPALDPPWTAEADAPAGGAVTLTLARE